MTTAASRRAQYILDNYRLEQTTEGWRAVTFFRGKVLSEIVHAQKQETIREARSRWGHFNFSDEAEAFASIFPCG